MSTIATTPTPPYVAVIFTSLPKDGKREGYGQTAGEMMDIAAEQDGYLGVEYATDASGLAITVSYWRDEDAVRAFKRVGAHMAAQKAGRERWYRAYHTRVATVSRAYDFDDGLDDRRGI